MPLSRITNPFLGTSGYRSVTDFTATAGQTSFTVPSYAVGYIDVYRNGVKLAAADFTATSGTTVVLANPATLGDVITAISTYMGTATNLSVTGGTINGQLVVNSATGVNPFITQVNSTEVLRIDSAGNLGIGTTTTNSKLNIFASSTNTSVLGTYANIPLLLKNTSSTNNNWCIIGTQDAAGNFATFFGTQTTNQASALSDFVIGTNPGSGATERMRIDSSGNVGIGTSSPSYKLEVKGPSATAGQLSIHDGTGDTTVSGNNAASLLFQARDTSVRTIAEIDAQNTTTNGTGAAMIFQTRVSDVLAERMRIDSSGALLVANTSLYTITGETAAKAQIAGNFVVGNAVASTNVSLTLNGVVNKAARIAFAESGAIKWLIGNGAASENGVMQIYDNVNGTGVQLARSGTSWSAISDEREKDIIEPIADAANKVSTLRAVIGKYKTDQTSTRRSFLIAQDVQAVLPEAVDDTDPNKLGVRYTEVIPLLVAAIKEQQALITQLQADVAALKDKA